MADHNTLSFKGKDLNDSSFSFDSRRGNRHCKILLFIDAMVEQSNIVRLQNWVAFIQQLINARPAIQHGVEIIPCLHLARVAALANRDMVRSIISQVLGNLNLTVDALGDILVVDWDGKTMGEVRECIGRAQNPTALLSSCPEFDTHALWMVVTDERNSIVSAAFSLPTPQDAEQAFAEFINDVIAAVPDAHIQNEIAAGYNDFYAQG